VYVSSINSNLICGSCSEEGGSNAAGMWGQEKARADLEIWKAWAVVTCEIMEGRKGRGQTALRQRVNVGLATRCGQERSRFAAAVRLGHLQLEHVNTNHLTTL
jgi:hypothetical protein